MHFSQNLIELWSAVIERNPLSIMVDPSHNDRLAAILDFWCDISSDN